MESYSLQHCNKFLSCRCNQPLVQESEIKISNVRLDLIMSKLLTLSKHRLQLFILHAHVEHKLIKLKSVIASCYVKIRTIQSNLPTFKNESVNQCWMAQSQCWMAQRYQEFLLRKQENVWLSSKEKYILIKKMDLKNLR